MRAVGHKIALAFVFSISLFLLTSCGNKDGDEVREPAVRPVKLITISGASDLQTARYPAVLDAAQTADLSFQVGGLIADLAVTDSQKVQAGDVIASLDQRDFQSQVTSARAQFENAEEEYQRAVRLSQADAIARSVLEQRKSQRDVAKSQLDTAEKALADTVIRAPFTGVIAQTPASARQTISAGQIVATLIGTENLAGAGIAEATVNVPASVIARSQEAGNRSAFVLLDAAPDTRIEATFKSASLLADSTTQTYAVTFTFDPPGKLVVLPGMHATLELSEARRTSDSQLQRVSVPLSAILSDGTARYVWIVDQASMTVSKREVTISDGIGESAVVTEGLALGETIATAGASYLAEGMQVRPWTD
jgi:RND family efflux transporter MFP subunit